MRIRLALILAITALVVALVTVASVKAWNGPTTSGLYGASGETASDLAAGQQGTGLPSSVAVSGEAKRVRLLVVDDSGTLIAIWSNTPSPEHRLVVRSEHRTGPEHQLTGDILGQYQALIDDIDWTQRGLVYTLASTSPD